MASDAHVVILTSFVNVLVISAGRLEHNKVIFFAIECISSMHEHSFILEDTEWVIPCEEKWEVVNVLLLSSFLSDFSIFLSWVMMRISQWKCKMLKTGNTSNYPCFKLSFWIKSCIEYIDVCTSTCLICCQCCNGQKAMLPFYIKIFLFIKVFCLSVKCL